MFGWPVLLPALQTWKPYGICIDEFFTAQNEDWTEALISPEEIAVSFRLHRADNAQSDCVRKSPHGLFVQMYEASGRQRRAEAAHCHWSLRLRWYPV